MSIRMDWFSYSVEFLDCLWYIIFILFSDSLKSKCGICGCFIIKSQIENHFEEIHTTNNKIFECEQCEIKFHTAEGKASHTHKKKATGIKKERRYQCELCEYSGYKKSALDDHRAVHTDEKPFVCTYPNCTKAFKRFYTLRHHINFQHDDSKSFTCDVCANIFSTQSKFKRHKLNCIVFEQKNVEEIKMNLDMNDCSKIIVSMEPAKSISRTNTNCEMIFSNNTKPNHKSPLITKPRHIKTHETKEKRTVLCHICSNEYPTISKLNCHIRRYHNPNKILVKNNKVEEDNTNSLQEKIYLSENIDVMFDYELETVESMTIDVVN